MKQKKMKLRIEGEYQAAEDSWAKEEQEHECESVACVSFDGETAAAEVLGGFSTARAYQVLQALQQAFGKERFNEALAALMLLDGFCTGGRGHAGRGGGRGAGKREEGRSGVRGGQ